MNFRAISVDCTLVTKPITRFIVKLCNISVLTNAITAVGAFRATHVPVMPVGAPRHMLCSKPNAHMLDFTLTKYT